MLIHRWAGILLGLHLALLCLAGAILIYGEDIDRLANPQVRVARGNGPTIPVEAALQAYRAARPGVAIDRIYPPASPEATYLLRVGPKAAQREAFVDPYTGRFLGERDREGRLLKLLADFHISLLLPKIGRNVNGIVAIVGLWLLFSGLFVWWPRARSQWRERLTLGRPRSARQALAKAHHLAGAYGFPVLFLALFTGVLWVFEDASDAAFAAAGAGPTFHAPKAAKPTGGATLSEDRLLAISERLAPGTHVVKFMLPTAKNRIAEVHREWPEGDGRGKKLLAFIDAESGAVVATDDSRRDNAVMAANRLTRPLHRGLWLGNITRFVYGLVGLFPMVLFITGVVKAFRRRRERTGDVRVKLERPTVTETGHVAPPSPPGPLSRDEPRGRGGVATAGEGRAGVG
jgi:uncharacterized iron-regulated membrane protein